MNKKEKIFLFFVPLLTLAAVALFLQFGGVPGKNLLDFYAVLLLGILLLINLLFYGIAVVWWIFWMFARGKPEPAQKKIRVAGIIVIVSLLVLFGMRWMKNSSSYREQQKEYGEKLRIEARSCAMIEGDPTKNFLSIVNKDRAIYYHPQRTLTIEEERERDLRDGGSPYTRNYWRGYDDLISQGYELKPCVEDDQ